MAGASGAAAAAAAIANAIKASGILVRVTPEDFQAILARTEKPLVVRAEGGIFSTHHKYLTSYKGFAFFTKSDREISLGAEAEIVVAEKIWLPQ